MGQSRPLLDREDAMPDTADEFTALLDRARRKDPEALAQLVRSYESKLRLVARVLLGPALRPYLDSVDLVQSVHRSLLVGLRDDKFALAGPEQLLALALTIVRRKVARQWRHNQRQRRLANETSPGANLPDLLLSLQSTEADPARAAQHNDAVRHLCGSLDEAERRMLELRLQGHSTAEMAAALELNPVALRVRMTRLRQRLRASGVLDDWL
jgi:RNA polymerase sigma-70 factor (ECF subfamily)